MNYNEDGLRMRTNCWLCRHFEYDTRGCRCKLTGERFSDMDGIDGCPDFETIIKEQR